MHSLMIGFVGNCVNDTIDFAQMDTEIAIEPLRQTRAEPLHLLPRG